jgi:hypothetical protein
VRRWQRGSGEWNMGLDYQRRWSVRASIAGFGQDICDGWACEYCAGAAEPDPGDLVVVDPGTDGFSYLFDLGWVLVRGVVFSRAPRGRCLGLLPAPGRIRPRSPPDAQDGENLLVGVFANGTGPSAPIRSAALRQSCAFGLDTAVVKERLDPACAKDRLFAGGWRSGPASLTHAERCAVAA